MIKVGVIGLGMMGNTHLDVYAKRTDVQVVAISDANPDRLSGKERAVGNVEGQAQGSFDINTVKKYAEGKDLIRDKSVEVVDICLTTPLHLEFVKRALKAGKHVLVEKPMARTYRDAAKMAALAAKSDRAVMVAQCMRFWPGWTWLKEAVEKKTYGNVLAATFRRLGSHPGGPFYENGALCGGGALDLHIHDTDFVQYLFGMPKAVRSVGYTRITGETDHIATRYEYDHVPMVIAEGGWAMAKGYGFTMQYLVNFENATARFDIGTPNPLTLMANGRAEPVSLSPGMGYEYEIAYFLECVRNGVKPTTVTPEDAANSVKIVEAEVKSVRSGRPVKIK